MKPQEALHEISTMVYRNTDYYEMRISKDCYKSIVSSLEKQIPKKPDYEGDGYDDSGNIIYDTWVCPNCGDRYEVDYELHPYCPMCGKCIDWRDLLTEKGGEGDG